MKVRKRLQYSEVFFSCCIRKQYYSDAWRGLSEKRDYFYFTCTETQIVMKVCLCHQKNGKVGLKK